MNVASKNKITGVRLVIFHHGTRNAESDSMALLNDFVEYLPEWTPDFWGVTEPLKNKFELEAIRNYFLNAALIPNVVGLWDFNWKRKNLPKSWGGFNPMVWSANWTRHARQHIYTELSPLLEEKINNYFLNACKKFTVDYGVFNWKLNSYSNDDESFTWAQKYGDYVSLRSIDMAKHLPAIYWAQVFGPPYVRLIGLDKLLSAPAFKVEQLGPEMVYIQLTESIFDIKERYEHVVEIRQKVSKHIDENIIFDASKPADHIYRKPDFKFPPKPPKLVV